MAKNEQGPVALTDDFKVQYGVSWGIDIWATNAKEAAREALRIQQDKGSNAKVFFVRLPNVLRLEIDLANDDDIEGRVTILNENCLQDFKCPQCNHEHDFVIGIQTQTVYTDDGSDSFDKRACRDEGFDNSSYWRCLNCNHEGRVGLFIGDPSIPYTVIGYYIDNGQAWMQHVMAESPQAAVTAGFIITAAADSSSDDSGSTQEEIAKYYQSIIDVTEVLRGHHQDCLDSIPQEDQSHNVEGSRFLLNGLTYLRDTPEARQAVHGLSELIPDPHHETQIDIKDAPPEQYDVNTIAVHINLQTRCSYAQIELIIKAIKALGTYCLEGAKFTYSYDDERETFFIGSDE